MVRLAVGSTSLYQLAPSDGVENAGGAGMDQAESADVDWIPFARGLGAPCMYAVACGSVKIRRMAAIVI